jgi:hypothetical protein
MSGYNQNVLFSVSQIRTEFRDTLGNVRSGTGTGFMLMTRSGRRLFITNRHNVDPLLKLGGRYQLISAAIRLRKQDVQGNFLEESRFFEVDLSSGCLKSSSTADVSVFVDPTYRDYDPSYIIYSLAAHTALADQAFFESKVLMMDAVSFIGYPGSSGKPWWDLAWNTPIARFAGLASPPHRPFQNAAILTGDVGLVSGLSFSGSSGSLVMLHEKGIPPGAIVDSRYAPATIIGIMSGHWREQDEHEMFRHSGLSYYTRSTAILDLLRANNALEQ